MYSVRQTVLKYLRAALVHTSFLNTTLCITYERDQLEITPLSLLQSEPPP